MKLKHCLLPCLLLLLLASSGCKQETPAAAPPAVEAKTAVEAKVETAATAEPSLPTMPSLKIATIDGAQYDLAAKRGGWVVVNFWATWCAPCIKEMPELDAFDTERDDVEVIGLAYEEIAPDEMRAFLKQRPVKYQIALIDTYDPPADFPTPRGLPMTYLIAPDGKVAKEFMGPVTKADLAAVIDGKAAAG